MLRLHKQTELGNVIYPKYVLHSQLIVLLLWEVPELSKNYATSW